MNNIQDTQVMRKQFDARICFREMPRSQYLDKLNVEHRSTITGHAVEVTQSKRVSVNPGAMLLTTEHDTRDLASLLEDFRETLLIRHASRIKFLLDDLKPDKISDTDFFKLSLVPTQRIRWPLRINMTCGRAGANNQAELI
jgi:hypothetical protein